jgi:O-antigen/teichoic acid export membrane protein
MSAITSPGRRALAALPRIPEDFRSRAMFGSIATGITAQIVIAVSGVVVARALGPENRGLLGLVFVLSAIATQIGSLGVPLAVTYSIAAEGLNARSLLRGLRAFRSFQLILFLTIHAVLILVVLAPRSPSGFLWVAFLSLVATATGISQMYGLAVLQGHQRFLAFNLLRLLGATLYAVGVVVLSIVNHASLVSITLVVIAVSVGTAGIIWLVVMRATQPGEDIPDVARGRIVKFGLRSLFGASAPLETFRLDQLLVGLALSPVALGYYIVALAFTNVTRFICQSIGMVTYPRIAGAGTRALQLRIIRQDFLLGAILAGTLTVTLIALVPWLLPFFFGANFLPAKEAAQILLIAAFFTSMRRILVDATRGAGWPAWGATAESLTLVALPAVIIATHYTKSLLAVALVLTAVDFVAFLAILGALLGSKYEHPREAAAAVGGGERRPRRSQSEPICGVTTPAPGPTP